MIYNVAYPWGVLWREQLRTAVEHFTELSGQLSQRRATCASGTHIGQSVRMGKQMP